MKSLRRSVLVGATVVALLAGGGLPAVAVPVPNAVVDNATDFLEAVANPEVETITLSGDITDVVATVVVNRELTIDLAGFDLSITGDAAGWGDGVEVYGSDGDLTIVGAGLLTINSAEKPGAAGIYAHGSAAVTIDTDQTAQITVVGCAIYTENARTAVEVHANLAGAVGVCASTASEVRVTGDLATGQVGVSAGNNAQVWVTGTITSDDIYVTVQGAARDLGEYAAVEGGWRVYRGDSPDFPDTAVRVRDTAPEPCAVGQVAAGGAHSLALANDGTVWAWGGNGDGQLGTGTDVASDVPVMVETPEALADLGLGFTAIAASGFHSLALAGDGSVWAWGGNWDGQLGNGTNDVSDVPVAVVIPEALAVLGLGFTAIAGGGSHSLALAEDGSVWAWGGNWNGQLGDGTNDVSDVPVMVETPEALAVLGLGFTAIAAGGSHSLALAEDGSVWAWGNNFRGQLGIGSNVRSNLPMEVVMPEALAVLELGFTAVAAGGFHSLAVAEDGSVWAWGNNEFGQLGDGTNAHSNVPVVVAAPEELADEEVGFTAVAAGEWHSSALAGDGSVWAWGANRAGQLGDGTNNNSDVPVAAITPEALADQEIGFTAVAGGGFHSLALAGDGSVWSWGWNEDGQLGDGSNDDVSFVPVAVLAPVSWCAPSGPEPVPSCVDDPAGFAVEHPQLAGVEWWMTVDGDFVCVAPDPLPTCTDNPTAFAANNPGLAGVEWWLDSGGVVVCEDPSGPSVSKFTLTFDGNGGSVSPGSRLVAAGSPVGSLPTPTRAGFTFEGWFDARSGGSRVTAATLMPAADWTVFARWSWAGGGPGESLVSRLAGVNRFGTAVAVSRASFGPGVAVVYVASGAAFPDAVAGAAVGGHLGGPVLLTRPDSLPGETVSELVRLAPGRIVVLGGPLAVSVGVEAALASFTAGPVSRQGGLNRFETAALVSQAAYPDGADVVFVAGGDAFADALTGSAAAGRLGGPVLLTHHGSLPAVTANELARLAPGRVVVLGGPLAVSDAVFGELGGFAPVVERLAGPNRFGTAVAVSRSEFGAGVPVVYVAVGSNWPDALTGAVAAAREGGPVLLTHHGSLPAETVAELKRLRPRRIVILGGTSVVSTAVATQLEQYATG